MTRTIIVGDVHGCLEEFQDLLDLVSYEQGTDRLIQVGDLMDRGPDPAGCVHFARQQGVELVRGNHEDKHCRWRKHEATRGAKKNPVQGINGVRAEQNLQLSDEDMQWLASRPMMVEVNQSLIVVHAGLEPAFSLAGQSSAVMRVRYVDADGEMVGIDPVTKQQPEGSRYWAPLWRGPQSVVYGHAVHSLDTPRVDRFEGGACYGIDTGCVYGGHLTALVVVDGQEPEFAQVKARQVYYEMHNPSV